MKCLSICTVVLEYNYGKPGASLGSVWLFNGDGTADFDSPEPLASLPGWVRIVGPIEFAAAGAIHAALKSFFEQSEVTVIDAGIAD